MALETNIIIELNRFPVIVIPDTTIVRLGTKLRFIVRISRQFNMRLPYRDLASMRLYFDGGTPKGFENVHEVSGINKDRSNEYNEKERDVILAEGTVGSLGQYKYGVKATDVFDEELFDEDPYLIVYP